MFLLSVLTSFLGPLIQLGGLGNSALSCSKGVFLSSKSNLVKNELRNFMGELWSNWKDVGLGLETVLISDVPYFD